jgi:tRNA isopentenyl-2-thiomethyl-A-37 hydroxylase MiaE
MSETWETILSSPTPKAWIDRALDSLDILLIDHAHCEKKAATSAISLIHKYPHYDLAKYLSPLAREELLHFEQVMRLINRHDFQYKNLKPCKYAKTLYDSSSNKEPDCDLYLDIFSEIFSEDWSQRLKRLSLIESNFINEKDECFRFHSGY